MSSIALYKNIRVEVTDYWESGGIQYASIKSCEGEPFIAGNKWPVHTAYTIARVDELQPTELEPYQVQPDNLLALALLYSSKKQWYSGEIIRLWKNGSRYAFLKEEDGFIKLSITGYQPSCLIFWLSIDGWQISERVDESYFKWARQAQEAIK
jgi:hypothetical protein